MPTAGVTHDIVLDGNGYLLASGKGAGNSYIFESDNRLASAGAAALNTVGTEALANGDPGAAGVTFKRIYFDSWRGVGRSFLRGGSGGDVHGVAGGPREKTHLNNSSKTSGTLGGQILEMMNMRPLKGGVGMGFCPVEYNVSGGGGVSYWGGIVYRGDVYLCFNNAGYRVAVDVNGNYSGLTFLANFSGAGEYVQDVGFDASGLPYYCTGLNMYRADNPASSLAIASWRVTTYQNLTFRVTGATLNTANTLEFIVNGVNRTITFGSAIRALCVHEGALFIGLDDALYRLEGDLGPSNPTSAPNAQDLFKYKLVKVLSHPVNSYSGDLDAGNWHRMTSFDGSLWGNLNGRFVRVSYNGAQTHGTVEIQPIPPGWARGVGVAGGCLFVALICYAGTGLTNQVWGYDPETGSWWRVNMNGGQPVGIVSGGHTVRDSQLIVFQYGVGGFSRFGFTPNNPSGLDATNYGLAWPTNYGSFTLPLVTPDDLAAEVGIQAGKPALVQLQRAGLEWDTINNRQGWDGWPALNTAGNLAAATFYGSLSTNEGISFTGLNNALGVAAYKPTAANIQAGRTDWVVPAAQGLIKPVAQIGQGAPNENGQNGNGWLLKFDFYAQVLPMIRRAFLDFKLVEFNVSPGRRWKLVLDLSHPPEAIGLDGAPNTVTVGGGEPALAGAQLMGWRLMNLWKSGKSATYIDLDGSSYTVKVVSYRLERSNPGNQPLGTQGPNMVGTVELMEVSE